jgi:hypothetical protein
VKILVNKEIHTGEELARPAGRRAHPLHNVLINLDKKHRDPAKLGPRYYLVLSTGSRRTQQQMSLDGRDNFWAEYGNSSEIIP